MINKGRKLFRLLPPLLLRDIKERHAGSVMGMIWSLLQPLLTVLVYWVVFSQIMKVKIKTDAGDVPFFIFMLSGLLPWLAFQEGVQRGASSIIEKRHVIKKVFYPAELFPVASVLSALVYQGIGFCIFLAGFFIWKGSISIIQIVCLPVLLSVQIVLAVGIALLLSALTVYLRDITQFLPLVFQVVFYMSTVLYPITSVPEKLRKIVIMNPGTPLIESYHSIILYDKLPDTGSILYLSVLTITVFFLGFTVFRKLKRGFADVL